MFEEGLNIVFALHTGPLQEAAREFAYCKGKSDTVVEKICIHHSMKIQGINTKQVIVKYKSTDFEYQPHQYQVSQNSIFCKASKKSARLFQLKIYLFFSGI